MLQYPPRHPPYLSTSLKHFKSWPVPIGVSHISLRHKKYNQGSGRKRIKNKRTIWAWVNSSARRLSCDTLHSLCICRIPLAWISNEISTKLRGMPTHLDWSSLTAARLYLMRLVSQMSGVDCLLPFCVSIQQLSPAGSFFQLAVLSLSDLPFLPHFRSRPKSRVQAFVWFRVKTNKKIVCLVHPLHSVTIVRYDQLFTD